ncbi:MAG: hypothetical protein ACLGIR_00525 [Actinomycetes bacterium]
MRTDLDDRTAARGPSQQRPTLLGFPIVGPGVPGAVIAAGLIVSGPLWALAGAEGPGGTISLIGGGLAVFTLALRGLD